MIIRTPPLPCRSRSAAWAGFVAAWLLLAGCSTSTTGHGAPPSASADTGSTSPLPIASSQLAAPKTSSAAAASGAKPSLSTSSSPRASASPDPAVVYYGRCYNPGDQLRIEPTEAAFGCDGTGDLRNMHWTSWGPSGADGTGTAALRGCTPSCAQGQEHYYSVVVHLAHPQPVPSIAPCTGGASFYATLILAFPHGFPSDLFGGPATLTYDGFGAESYPALPGVQCGA